MGWKTYEVVMDIKTGVQSGQVIQIVTEDYGTNILKVKLVRDGRVPYDLTEKNVKIMVKTPSGARIQQACTIENAVSGTIIATLQQSLILEEGTYSAEFQIYEAGSNITRLTTPIFRYFVRRSLQTAETIQATNEYTMLQEMLSRAEVLIELLSVIDAQETLDRIAELEVLHSQITVQLEKVKDYELLEQDFIDLTVRVAAFEANIATAIANATTATSAANTATSSANSAATNANSKAELANTAASNADDKAALAQQATTDANAVKDRIEILEQSVATSESSRVTAEQGRVIAENAREAFVNNHRDSRMPHKIKDLKANKEYTFGLQLSAEGNPQIIFEEVM